MWSSIKIFKSNISEFNVAYRCIQSSALKYAYGYGKKKGKIMWNIIIEFKIENVANFYVACLLTLAL